MTPRGRLRGGGSDAARRDAWRWLMLALAVVVQTVMLYVPGQHGPATSLPLDKVVHFLLFAVVAALAVWAGVGWPWVVALLVVQAVLSEVVQQAVLPERGGEIGDVLADLAGTAAGVLVIRGLRRPSR